METTISPLPKVFWKYYDAYRRKQISLKEYSKLTDLPERVLRKYLREVWKSFQKNDENL